MKTTSLAHLSLTFLLFLLFSSFDRIASQLLWASLEIFA